MAITLNTKSYVMDRFVTKDKARYTGPAHTYSIEDTVTLGSQPISAASNGYNPVARTSVRTAKSVTVNGIIQPIVFETFVSVPVGTASADVDAVRDDHGDFLISANGQALVNALDINQ